MSNSQGQQTADGQGDGAKAWTAFWESGHGAMCLPSSRGAHERLGRIWQSTASNLPPKAKVLDLACGSGVVGYLLRQRRPDVSVVGVDYARIGPSRMAGVELVSGVALEQLPFEDGSFDGAVSQFGIEYADPRGAVRELSRVMRPAASITLVMHHADSPVVMHNRRRNAALGELIGPAVESAFLEGNRAALGRLFASLRTTFAGQDVIAEFEQGLGSGMVRATHDRVEFWRDLTAMVSREREILSALASAAVANCQPWLDQLAEGFEMESATAIREANDLPLAWLLRGRRI